MRDCSCCHSLNMTYNMSKFMYDFLDDEQGIRVFSGLTGKQAIPIIEKFFERCNRTEGLAEKYNSPNGWGTVESCILVLGLLLVQCTKHPRNKIFSQ